MEVTVPRNRVHVLKSWEKAPTEVESVRVKQVSLAELEDTKPETVLMVPVPKFKLLPEMNKVDPFNLYSPLYNRKPLSIRFSSYYVIVPKAEPME